MIKILCERCEATFLTRQKNKISCEVCGTPLKLEPTIFKNHYLGKVVSKNHNLDESIQKLELIMRREQKRGTTRPANSFNLSAIKLYKIFSLPKLVPIHVTIGVICLLGGLFLFTYNYLWITKRNVSLVASSEENKIFSSLNDYLKYDLPKIDVDKASSDYQVYMDYSKLDEIKESKSKKSNSSALINGGEKLIAPVSASFVSSAYGYRIHPLKKVTEFHQGIDIPRPYGSPIKAALSGKVTFNGWKQGYGNVIILKHENGYITLYGHNSRNIVKVGTRVKQNDTIALVGSTGNSTGPHLHFELRKDNKILNPSKYLKLNKSI
jgi:murein DD-endopeptidase MepM/ murein hydrolase activator NlpD